MNAHDATLHPMQDAGFFDVSSMARMFSRIVAGLSTIAAYAPVTRHEVNRVFNDLNGVVTALEPLIAMTEQLTEYIHSRREIACGHYLDASGEAVADYEKFAANLRELIAVQTKIDQSVEQDQEINVHQRLQLHAASQRAIALSHRGVEAIEALTGAIITHDLDAEPPPTRTWDNLDDMLDALKAQAA